MIAQWDGVNSFNFGNFLFCSYRMLLYQQFRILDKVLSIIDHREGKGKEENSDYILLYFKYNFKNLDRVPILLYD